MFTIVKKSIRHVGQSKDYHAVLVSNNETGKSVVLFRWGKAGKWGQMKAQVFPDQKSAVHEYESKIREKEGGGYRNDLLTKSELLADIKELQTNLGAGYWANMGANTIRHLSDEADVTGVRSPVEREFIHHDDGSFEEVTKPRLVEEVLPSKEEIIARESKKNPLWGAF